jgi:F0F1-type ATP synthase membrane subunit a
VAELAQRSLWGLALAVLVMNLPFGFWRAGAKRFTPPWFVAVHAPVPFVILLRVVSGLGWHLVSLPVLIGAFFTGQLLGGRMRRRR